MQRNRAAFSYVGACQVLMGLYIIFSHGLSRFVRSAHSLLFWEGSERSDNLLSLLVLTSKAPRRAQSAIRAHEDLPPAHENTCASDDAHSPSRALDGESLAQKTGRAVVPRTSLRGPAVQLSRGNACSVRFSFVDGTPHPGQKLSRDGHGGRLAAAALGDPQEHAPHMLVGADGGPGCLLQDPPQVARAGLGDVSDALFSSRGVDPRIESGEAADRLGVLEPAEVADFGDHGRGGELRDAGEAQQNLTYFTESFAADHFTDGSLGLVDLPMERAQRLVAVGVTLLLVAFIWDPIQPVMVGVFQMPTAVTVDFLTTLSGVVLGVGLGVGALGSWISVRSNLAASA